MTSRAVRRPRTLVQLTIQSANISLLAHEPNFYQYDSTVDHVTARRVGQPHWGSETKVDFHNLANVHQVLGNPSQEQHTTIYHF